MLGARSASGQTTATAETGGAARAQTSAQTNTGAQASTNASAANSSATNASASTTNNAANNSAILADGTKIDATLATSLDAKRSKVGDEVEVRTEEDIKQDGKVILKKGAHLVGHVSQVQARANGQTESQLGIVFDHAVLKNGQQVPFNASILAMASAQSASGASMDANDLTGSGAEMRTGQATARTGGGLAGGVASTANATGGPATGAVMNTASTVPVNAGSSLKTATHSSGAVGGLSANGRLTSNSSGVFGLEGVSINSAASNATQGSMIVSSTRNVHLDSGTQLLLRTNAQAQ
jgi:hypothetical protein